MRRDRDLRGRIRRTATTRLYESRGPGRLPRGFSMADPILWCDGEDPEVVRQVNYERCDDVFSVDTDRGREYFVAPDRETAGRCAREYWEDMARNDPKEFAEIVGTEVLVNWALGIADGPGYIKVRSLDEWLDEVEKVPEEELAGYDGEERIAYINEALAEMLGGEFERRFPARGEWLEVVAYRHN